MNRFYTCLAAQHDAGLVVLAAVVCLLASWTTIDLGRRCLVQGRGARISSVMASGLVAGSGIWTTHFVAMLAFSPGVPIEYDVELTLVSIVVAIVGGWAAFLLATRGGKRWVAWGGVCIGLDIAAMHYTGMAAVELPTETSWDPALIELSLVLAGSLGAASLYVGLLGSGRWRRLLGVATFAGAICSTHFVGVAAFVVDRPQGLIETVRQIPSWWLAAGLVAMTALILGFALAALLLDAHLAERKTREEQRLRTLADAAFEGLLIHVGGTILDLNESLVGLLGGTWEAVIGRQVGEFIVSDTVLGPCALAGAGFREAIETELRRLDGQHVAVEILGRAIEHQGRSAQVLSVRDISERRTSERRIHHLAFHDALTDVANRRLFGERLEQELARASHGGVAILCLDLDRFKIVNDSLGHAIGDLLLRAVARRLQFAAREADLVARLGGDVFAIVQTQVRDAEPVLAFCRRLVDRISDPFDIEGNRINIGVSIGAALIDDVALEADEALKRANLALYRAKAEGRNTFRLYETHMDEHVRARHKLELDLRRAVQLEQFEVHYQPLVDVASGRIGGFEALARWRHPERGSISPGEFIPLAEEIGLIDAIGHQVLRRACADAAQWPGSLTVAVNLSPAQFRYDGLVAHIKRTLADSGLAPSRLTAEVTESLFIGDEANALTVLHALHDLGVMIAMDDFGTGYSSLSYLRRFPFDKLKIDQSLIRDSGHDLESQAIVKAVIGLSHSLGMIVNAEGIETEKQFQLLQREDCDEAQGYLFSRPVPVAQIPDLLARHGRLDESTPAPAPEFEPG